MNRVAARTRAVSAVAVLAIVAAAGYWNRPAPDRPGYEEVAAAGIVRATSDGWPCRHPALAPERIPAVRVTGSLPVHSVVICELPPQRPATPVRPSTTSVRTTHPDNSAAATLGLIDRLVVALAVEEQAGPCVALPRADPFVVALADGTWIRPVVPEQGCGNDSQVVVRVLERLLSSAPVPLD